MPAQTPLHPSYSTRLARIANALPFDSKDIDAAGRAFVTWRGSGAKADLDVVLLWAYCYTQEYFWGKFSRERSGGVSDYDDAVSRAYKDVLNSLTSVRRPELFPHYVSVVCRNELKNHRARRRETVELEDGTSSIAPDHASDYDRALLFWTLRRAIADLPLALQEIAQMWFVEGRTYQDIAHTSGRPIASVRTYVHKAKNRLQEHPAVCSLLGRTPQANDAPQVNLNIGDEG